MKGNELESQAQPCFNPSGWHTCQDHAWENCLETSNCYAYALDRPDYYWAIPGHGFAQARPLDIFKSYDSLFRNISYREHRKCLARGAQRDGLIPIKEPEQRPGYYAVALFFSDHKDYGFHWYRQDHDGTWSHKNGWRPACNYDSKGHVIRDPRQSENSGYSILGGFFLVPSHGIRLRADFSVTETAETIV